MDNPIARLQALPPNPAYDLRKEQGYSDYKFSELCLWKGYQEANHIARHYLNRTELAPENCRLLITYAAFLQAANLSQSKS